MPKSEQQDTSTSNSPPLAQLSDKHTYFFRSPMAKVELHVFGLISSQTMCQSLPGGIIQGVEKNVGRQEGGGKLP